MGPSSEKGISRIATALVVLLAALCLGHACGPGAPPRPDARELLGAGEDVSNDAREVQEAAPGGDLPLEPGCVEVYRSGDGTCAGLVFDHGDVCVDCETRNPVAPGVPTTCIREYQPATTCGPYPEPASVVHDCRELVDGAECVYTEALCRIGWGRGFQGIGRRSALCLAR